MFEVLWGKKFNQSSIQNAQITSAVGEEGRLTFRNAVAVLAVLFCLHSHNSFAVTDDTIPFNIPQQRADTALTQFAEQANLTLVFPFEQLKDKTANRLVGNYPIATAINLLLHNTGLTPRFSDQLVLTIASEPKGKRMNTTNSSKRKTVLAGLVGLFAAGGMTQAVAQGGEAATSQSAIDEIIVTANKREQSLQDTAMSIRALSQDEIERNGYIGMNDYLSTIPGVSQMEIGVGNNRLSMRGISASQTDETSVGVYLGEVSLSHIGTGANGNAVDIKLVDIERVEVLRGPQGTLFGSGTMGGAVRNIPNAPNLTEVESELQVGFSDLDGADRLNNKITGVVNIPLVENQLALRIAAYRFENRGYVDMVSDSDPSKVVIANDFGGVLNNRTEVGGNEFAGVRASLLWQPADNLSVTLMHARQDLDQNGMSYIDPDIGGYKSTALDFNGEFDGQEGRSDEGSFTNLVINYDLSWGNLISSTTISDSTQIRDIAGSRFIPLPLPIRNENSRDNFTQELRVSSQLSGPVQFLGGIYYEDMEFVGDTLVVWGGDDALNPFGNDLFEGPDGTDIKQTAFFGEVYYDIADQFKLTLGGRWFDYERKILIDQSGALGTVSFDGESTEKDFKGKVNLEYTPSDDALIYTQWAQGFRLGQPVVVPPLGVCDTDNDGILDGSSPPTPINTSGALDSDNLDSIEVGGKFSFLDNQLITNIAIYSIDWKGIPINVAGSCGFGTILNGGEARSQGLEVEATYQVSEKLRLNFGLGYNDAELSKDAPGLGSKGDRLPYSQRISGNLSIDYNFYLNGFESFIHANYAYVGDFHTDLAEESIEIGDYSKLSLRLGLSINEHWDVELYGTNLTNSDDLSGFEPSVGGGFRLTPRQIGLDVRYQF